MKLSELKQDLALEAQGVDVALPCGVTVRVARMGNPKAQARMERLVAPYRHLTRRGKQIPRKEAERFTIEVVAHEVLKAWDLEDDDGKPIPYTADKANEVLSAPEHRDFLDEIIEAASYRETFRREEIEESEKNSGRPPAGSSSGGRSSKSSAA